MSWEVTRLRTVSTSWLQDRGPLSNMTENSRTTEITQLLQNWRKGDQSAFDQLLPLVYQDLRRLARSQLRGHRKGTLDPTGLVHEAFFRLVDAKVDWQSRGHFYAVSARAMRQVIVGFARRRMALKRGGDQPPITLDEDIHSAIEEQASQLVALDSALDALAAHDERLARVVDCRYFAGLTEQETAEALGTSLRTAQRAWHKARALLHEAMSEGQGTNPAAS